MKTRFTFTKVLLISLLSSTCFAQVTPSIGHTGNIAIPQTFENVAFAKNKLAPPVDRKGSALLFSKYTLCALHSNSLGVLEKYPINYNIETKILPDEYVPNLRL